MIIVTNFITISFRMLKKSTIILACSPIFPIAMPKAIKNPIKPIRKNGKTKKKQVLRKFLHLVNVLILPANPVFRTILYYTSLGTFIKNGLTLNFHDDIKTPFILQYFTKSQFQSPTMSFFFIDSIPIP